MIRRLKIKFVLVNMAIIMVVICIILCLIYHFAKADLEKDSLSILEKLASDPFRLEHPGGRRGEVKLPYFSLHIGEQGELVQSSGGGFYDLSDSDFLESIIEEASASGMSEGLLEDYSLRFSRVAVKDGEIIVFVDISSELATLNSLLRTCAFIGVISFIVFLAISILLSGWVARPVDRAWQQQRQFVTNASHELKTPLTVIATNADLLSSDDCDEESRLRLSAGILSMSRQMSVLVQQMLELARADSGQAEPSFSNIDLSKLVSDAVLPFEPIFFERGITLESQICNGISILGDRSQLCQLTDILLDNAQKYSSKDSTTCITLKKSGRNHCILTVSNQGDPISKEDQKNIFKRFYRVDTARSSGNGFGLGLSIAESIVRQHKGRIWSDSRNGINCFYVELPCV